MGRELVDVYPAFRRCLLHADVVLADFGADWSLLQELQRDEKSTLVNEPRLSQPVCVAVQVCLVDLLKSWNIVPSTVTSHSSGGIADAYAAGALTFKEALGVAYFRGAGCGLLQRRLDGQVPRRISGTGWYDGSRSRIGRGLVVSRRAWSRHGRRHRGLRQQPFQRHALWRSRRHRAFGEGLGQGADLCPKAQGEVGISLSPHAANGWGILERTEEYHPAQAQVEQDCLLLASYGRFD
ncbi:Highly reducing polyketide synthase sor1 [Colletotrichum spinosum]|uniref:Highly reducing polyketide synthase sor1 n=1 Tax=Colletotrichum spinosum TaxID=1347390 RepID=A0A4R8Q6X6_9PEZI|nr:Highly reducing polyketide synthase sor1 [Colletotrichum spinosum]